MTFQLKTVFFLWWIQLLLLAASGQISNSTDSNNITCTVDHKYDHLDVREVLGKWRVVEVYLHIKREGVNQYYNCPMVTIWEVDGFRQTTYGPSTENQLFHVQHINAKFRQDYRHLRLLWDEAGSAAEYALYFRNDSAGYWHVYDGQNGSLTNMHSYQQFSGTVQVLKAVNDHLLLNFCQEGIHGRLPQLYSVLFSRVPGELSRWEIEAVHNLLQNKRLSIASRRMVCGNNGADRQVYSIVLSLITCFMAFVVGSS